MAGSDPILGAYITPKSLWASGVAPVHEGTGPTHRRFVFAALSKPELLPELSGKSCQNSLAILAIAAK
jgi:hypothetical protein